MQVHVETHDSHRRHSVPFAFLRIEWPPRNNIDPHESSIRYLGTYSVLLAPYHIILGGVLHTVYSVHSKV